MAPVAREPGDVAVDGMTADLDPTVIAVGGLQLVEGGRRGVREVARDLGVQVRLVAFDRQEIVRALRPDRSCDLGLAADGIDGDQGTGERQALQQQWNCLDLIGFPGHGFLPEHQPLAAGPGRDQMQRLAPLGFGVAAARGLAIDRDEIRLALAQLLHPAALAAPFPQGPTPQASAG